MSAVDLDRQGIERRDFPIVRRGYDPASVDAHLRGLAAEVEELRRDVDSRGRESSLAASAGTRVQGILEAAQATAEAIEREAAHEAQRARDAANADAMRTREEAVAHAREHVGEVSKATEALLERVGSMDGETRTLIDSLHTGASRLAGDLAAVETNMEALYDAAAGRATGGQTGGESNEDYNGADHTPVAVPLPEPHSEPFVKTLSESQAGVQGDPYAGVVDTEPHIEAHHLGQQPEERPLDEEPLFSQEHYEGPSPASESDLDGARLVALNMALNGDPREETGRYLAENFNVPDRDRLLDEVYAAIEG
jgi:DivIVA domain-containing protein